MQLKQSLADTVVQKKEFEKEADDLKETEFRLRNQVSCVVFCSVFITSRIFAKRLGFKSQYKVNIRNTHVLFFRRYIIIAMHFLKEQCFQTI